ncbi:MAG: HlyD family efflux transporter periplasmic adaptor subunit [Betaproteobacteria bacterium]
MTARVHGRAVTHLLLWTTVSSVLAFVVWANWAELDQITRAPGQVIATSRNQVIQAPPNGGVLEALMVQEGAVVKKGQVMLRFESARLRAAYEEAASKAAALRATLARLDAEIYDREAPIFPRSLDAYAQFKDNQLALFRKRRSLLEDDLRTLEKLRDFAQQELDMNLPLLKGGDVSRAEVLKLQRQVADLAGQISSKRNKYLQDSQADLAKAQEDLSGTLQVMAQRKDELDLTVAHAPMDGVVRNVRLTTLGGVARPGDELLQIVPVDDSLVIEAKVKTSEIGFMRVNLLANVKLDAYDYAIYGTLRGHVSYISADTLTEQIGGQEVPYYRVHVKIDRSDLRPRPGEKIDIQPGMTGVVEIKTGEKSVWSYLTKPITKTLGESMRER